LILHKVFIYVLLVHETHISKGKGKAIPVLNYIPCHEDTATA